MAPGHVGVWICVERRAMSQFLSSTAVGVSLFGLAVLIAVVAAVLPPLDAGGPEGAAIVVRRRR
jgi:hypothetical protein